MAEEVVRIMSTSGAQRRGKPLEPKPTILVESGGVLGRQEPPPIATVKRNSCGTGPFDRHWLNLDCCGLFCAGFTYMLHCYGVYAVCVVLIPPWMSTTDPESSVRSLSVWGLFHQVAFPLVAILAVIAHFKAMTTDPGAVPPDAKPLKEEEEEEKQDEYERLLPEDPLQPPPKPRKGHRLCRRCKSYKPQRAHHCSVCRRCIIKMDHHCPWVNNCVGIGNHKFFLLFVFYTFLSCIYSMTLVILRFMTCMGARGPHHQRQHVTCLDRPSDLLYILGLLVESLLFGMFTCCMMFDQSEGIREWSTRFACFATFLSHTIVGVLHSDSFQGNAH